MNVIFDMDGVLVDSELHWKKVESEFLRGVCGSWDEQWQQKIIGMSITHVHRFLVEQHGLTLSREELLDYYRPLAIELYGSKVQLLEGATELLAELTANEIPISVCSSSPLEWMEIVLERFSLITVFSLVVSSDHVDGVGKPSPAIYQYAARELNARPSECAAIEDSKNGVQSAKDAGMYCIGLRNGFNAAQDLSVADTVIEGLSELNVQSLKKLFGGGA